MSPRFQRPSTKLGVYGIGMMLLLTFSFVWTYFAVEGNLGLSFQLVYGHYHAGGAAGRPVTRDFILGAIGFLTWPLIVTNVGWMIFALVFWRRSPLSLNAPPADVRAPASLLSGPSTEIQADDTRLKDRL